MDYAEEFELQGHAMDELLLEAFALPQAAFLAPGADGSPSLRDLLVEWLETQRRAVQGSILGYQYHPLPPTATTSVAELARAFGGFRLTFMETVEAAVDSDMERRVPWTSPDGTTKDVAVSHVLAQLAEHGERMLGLVETRLEQLVPRPTDTPT